MLTFDVYGTIVDWEKGLLSALRPILEAYAVNVDDETLLEAYAAEEAALESGPYLRYREVLGRVLDGLGGRFGFTPALEERESFAGSVGEWPPFEDSRAALERLKPDRKLGILTNCDDDLIAMTVATLGIEFDWMITAEQLRRYKPNPAHFFAALERIESSGIKRERVVHVAQSLFHDHVPAKRLGLTTIWIDRRGGKRGSGA
ncbi:MAG: HAD-IA family hydrolase, partial [Candidatus Eremiobacteraeota bacterium]|nr:HAD-IA family hydrolase [Candidatus Eremiobacteraeota bacterium]